MPLIGFSQIKTPVVITYQNQTVYCLNEEQALIVVELHRSDSILRAKIVDYEGRVKALEDKNEATETIVEATDSIVDIEKERTEMTKKELRREKRKAVGKWFKDKWQTLVIGVGAFGLGVGVGLGAGL